MHLYITPGAKRVTISSLGGGCSCEATKAAGKKDGPSNRRFSFRSALPTILIAGVLLPFVFIRAAFVALDGASRCSSDNHCFGWRFGPQFLWGGDTSLRLGNELVRALIEAQEEGVEGSAVEAAPKSFSDLVADVTANQYDLKTFALKTKAMLLKMDSKARIARQGESIYRNLATIGTPKSMHCLSLRLAEEYSVNALARAPLPPPEFISHLTDRTRHHIALLTDNILAAAVAISTAMTSSSEPQKMVFHILTDKKTYGPMHAWFALNPVTPAVVEVKGLHQFEWPTEVNVRLFPKLDRIVFLDDDVIVQRDLSPLWSLNLKGKANGAVIGSFDGEEGNQLTCLGGKFSEHLNFSNPIISEAFNMDSCGWLHGMNIFNLRQWRRDNITQKYLHWLKLNIESGFTLWRMGSLPPALLAFDGHTYPIDPSWHIAGLGQFSHNRVQTVNLESAAVVHFSGPAKPWLEIGSPDLRALWQTHAEVQKLEQREEGLAFSLCSGCLCIIVFIIDTMCTNEENEGRIPQIFEIAVFGHYLPEICMHEAATLNHFIKGCLWKRVGTIWFSNSLKDKPDFE
ncbi:putative galacturonosyltransferase 15 [Acorus gramineus]|uniref:Hexosyltransferase n=1 Tax=Acorus gramineus TaxID=55184 RepID=A0AAV9BH61_ACOGR|nr:putative galacturonosyltransferase 15 [Acorus gramineus]